MVLPCPRSSSKPMHFVLLLFIAESLRVVVTDPSGAVIPNATLEVRGSRTRTGATGEATFPSLPAGPYEVRVSARGFQPSNQRLTLSQPTLLNVRLSVR